MSITLFNSCKNETIELYNSKSKLSMMIPNRAYNSVKQRDNEYLFFLDKEITCSITILHHYKIEGKIEALKLLLNKTIEYDCMDKSHREITRNFEISNYPAVETFSYFKNINDGLFVRTIYSDNRNYQIEIKFYSEKKANLSSNKINNIIKSIEFK